MCHVIRRIEAKVKNFIIEAVCKKMTKINKFVNNLVQSEYNRRLKIN